MAPLIHSGAKPRSDHRPIPAGGITLAFADAAEPLAGDPSALPVGTRLVARRPDAAPIGTLHRDRAGWIVSLGPDRHGGRMNLGRVSGGETALLALALTAGLGGPADVRAARLVLGLSTPQLARALGVSGDRTVRRWEDGTRQVAPEQARDLARLLVIHDGRPIAGGRAARAGRPARSASQTME